MRVLRHISSSRGGLGGEVHEETVLSREDGRVGWGIGWPRGSKDSDPAGEDGLRAITRESV